MCRGHIWYKQSRAACSTPPRVFVERNDPNLINIYISSQQRVRVVPHRLSARSCLTPTRKSSANPCCSDRASPPRRKTLRSGTPMYATRRQQVSCAIVDGQRRVALEITGTGQGMDKPHACYVVPCCILLAAEQPCSRRSRPLQYRDFE